MRNEDRLHDALESVAPAYHLVLDGAPEEGAAYRFSGVNVLYESDVPLVTKELFEIYVFQREYSAGKVAEVIAALRDAGFAVNVAGQSMQEGYYRDELRASRTKED